jgi:hypothetical protein
MPNPQQAIAQPTQVGPVAAPTANTGPGASGPAAQQAPTTNAPAALVPSPPVAAPATPSVTPIDWDRVGVNIIESLGVLNVSFTSSESSSSSSSDSSDTDDDSPLTVTDVAAASPVSSLPDLGADAVDDYFFFEGNLLYEFDDVFELLAHQKRKWKEGVRLWPKLAYSRQPYNPKCESTAMDTVVERLLRAHIILPTKREKYVSNIFFVPKSNGKLRPVVNYKHLTKSLPTPKMTLPSLYQIATRKEWPQNMWYCKIDIKNAFYNIAIHPSSQAVTTFVYKSKYFKFRAMPFGISIAPYVMQAHLNAILRVIRKINPLSWGHIDDILLGNSNKETLIKAKWVRERKKSLLVLSKRNNKIS